MARRKSAGRRRDQVALSQLNSLLGGKSARENRLHEIEPLELRNAPSDSLGLLFAFPLADLIADTPAITSASWQDPLASSNANRSLSQRLISVAEPRTSFASARTDVDAPFAAVTSTDDSSHSERPPAPTNNVLDRIFGGLDANGLAPRGLERGAAGIAASSDLGSFATFLPYPSAGDATGGATTTPSPAPVTFQSDDVDGTGVIDDIPVDAPTDEAQVNWYEIAIALAEKQGKLELVDGEIDLDAAMDNLAREMADRAASIGFGEAKAQIIGENPTVDEPVGGETKEDVGFGESMGMSSMSGSGSGSGYPCGQSSGNNQAPIAHDDAIYAISPTSTRVVSAPGVLLNDSDGNGTQLTAHLVSGAAHGTVTLNQDGSFTYTPNGSPAGADGFYYRAFDGNLYSCPAYVALRLPYVDVTTDSNNNGWIDGLENGIEMNSPGKVIAYNKDDDNRNGTPDYQDTSVGPYGDPDLAVSYYGIISNSSYLTDFTFQWVVTGPLKIWSSPTKTAMPTTFTYGDPLSYGGEFWVEGTGVGTGTVELKMFRPGGALHHSDIVRFTAVDFDLDTDSDNSGTINGSLTEDTIEMDAPGKMVRHNRDDDNANGQADRLDPKPFVNAQGSPMNDDDLVPATVTLDSGGVSLSGWTVTLTRSIELRVFKTQSKEEFPSFDFTVSGGANAVPSTVWVEGAETGQGTVNIALKSPSGYAPLSDGVLFTSMYIDLIAYRPQTEGPGYGAPFPRTEVPFALEETPGVGIRVNGDDDNANNTPDRNDTGAVAGENDLIEIQMIVEPQFPIPGVELSLSRNNSAIRVWDDPDRSYSMLNSASWTFSQVGDQHYWVEWKGAATTPSSTLKLQARATNTQGAPAQFSDSLKFYPFRSVVIAFLGNTNVPLDPGDGASLIAEELYSRGYDAHAYIEEVVSATPNVAYNEVVNAVQNRGVTQVAIVGYSQGGGATHVLAEALETNRQAIGTFTINVTAYLDAVIFNDWDPETRRPRGSLYHINYYQLNGGSYLNLHGEAVPAADYNLNVNTTTWGEELDHSTIDHDANVMSRSTDGSAGSDGTHDGITDRVSR